MLADNLAEPLAQVAIGLRKNPEPLSGWPQAAIKADLRKTEEDLAPVVDIDAFKRKYAESADYKAKREAGERAKGSVTFGNITPSHPQHYHHCPYCVPQPLWPSYPYWPYHFPQPNYVPDWTYRPYQQPYYGPMSPIYSGTGTAPVH